MKKINIFLINTVKLALSCILGGNGTNPLKRGFSAFLGTTILTATILAALLPVSAVPAYAAEAGKNLQLGASVLEPVMTSVEDTRDWDEKNRVTTAQTVYFGKSGTDKWFAVGYGGNGAVQTDGTVTLFAVNLLKADKIYRDDGSSNSYAESDIRKSLIGEDGEGGEGGYYASKFENVEKNVIVARRLEHGDYSPSTNSLCDGISDTSEPTDKLWLLSTKEADLIGQSYRETISYLWWLRSPGYYYDRAALVNDNGCLNFQGLNFPVDQTGGVRPAFNINLSSIILTSAAEGGKDPGTAGDGTLNPVGEYTGNGWKLTILDSARDSFTASAGTEATLSVTEGYDLWTVPVTYSGAATGSGSEHVSAILTGSDGVALYYGHIATDSAASSDDGVAVNIPTGLEAGTYTLNVFSEQCNGDKKTDYSSPVRPIELTVMERVATPTFSPAGGSYSGSKSVEISCNTDGADIYYTTDGTTPAKDTGEKYTSAISVTRTTTIKAIAVKEGMADSEVAEAVYRISIPGKVSTPAFSPEGGEFTETQDVAISCATSGAAIYYTTDGSTPTASGKEYTSPITVSETTTIKAIAAKAGMYDSGVGTASYTKKTIPVESVTLDRKSASIDKGDKFTLEAAVLPSDATNKEVIWESSNTGVVTVTNKGVVKGIKAGTAKITATAKDGSGKSASCTVTVKEKIPVKSVKLNETKTTVYKGKTVKLKASVLPTNATNKEVAWKSSNTNIATVSSTGVVKGIKAGTAKITATAKDGSKKSGNCTVTVKNPIPVKSIELNKTKATVKKGKTVQLKATVSPSNATNKEVAWKSSNKKIATVDKNGKVKGIKVGTVKITATAKDGSKKKATCTVTVK